MKRHAQYAFLAILTLLVGCSQLGIPKPQTFNQRLAVGYTTVTAVRQTAITLLQADKITANDASNVQEQADNARAGLDLARSIHATNPQAAETRLDAVIVGLNALQAYLQARGEK